eukprot:874305-Pyramimonas_sp.AAC.1
MTKAKHGFMHAEQFGQEKERDVWSAPGSFEVEAARVLRLFFEGARQDSLVHHHGQRLRHDGLGEPKEVLQPQLRRILPTEFWLAAGTEVQ